MTPSLYTTVPNDPAQRLLVEQALERDPLIWSPFEDDETRGYTPIPVRGDPERPFGIVRHKGPHRWQELTGRRDVLTHRGYYHDALAGIIRDYRISHWWNDAPRPPIACSAAPATPAISNTTTTWTTSSAQSSASTPWTPSRKPRRCATGWTNWSAATSRKSSNRPATSKINNRLLYALL